MSGFEAYFEVDLLEALEAAGWDPICVEDVSDDVVRERWPQIG